MGSGDLPVFATPSMVALMENAAMTAAAAALPAGSTTVGAEMNVTHIEPGAGRRNHRDGRADRSRGTQADFQRRRATPGGMIGEGVHIRYVVDREKFMAKLG